MTTENITILTGLPEHLREQAAHIYVDAFQRKLRPIMGTPQVMVAMLREHCSTANAIVAMHNDKLVGLTGVHHNGTTFVHLPRRAFQQRFGWLRGLCKYGLLALLERPMQPGELLMDGIAVDPSCRGQGIGTRLLNGVFDFARLHCYQTVRLDVIDTNPGARKLYERMGFTAIKTASVAWLRPVMGFSAVTTMVKSL